MSSGELTAISPQPQPESHLSSLIYETSQQVQVAMDEMLNMTTEIEENCKEIMEEIEKSKESVVETKKVLEVEQETFQNAAYAALEMLCHRGALTGI